MAAEHLVGVRVGALRGRVGEVVPKVIERGRHRPEVAAEPFSNRGCCVLDTACVVVEQDVGDVVPVLQLS